jgi:hypothetical protein
MTAVVKLVFGADYDKTRLAEYALALDHANETGMNRGELSRAAEPITRAASKGWCNTGARPARRETDIARVAFAAPSGSRCAQAQPRQGGG